MYSNETKGLSLGEGIRHKVFALKERGRRRGLLRLADEVGLFYRDPSKLEQSRSTRLHAILEHARTQVGFYKRHGGAELRDFPVINKRRITENYAEFCADGFERKKVLSVTTSGSSGVPFECFHEQEKVRQKLADLLYFNARAGYEVGMRHMLIRATRKPYWKLWLQNEIWVDPTRQGEELFAFMRKSLLRCGVKVAIGHPSVMFKLADLCRQMGDAPDEFLLRGYIATSEMLWSDQWEVIQDVFGCRVMSRYASEEFGVLGQSEGACRQYALNTRSLIIEVLDSQDQPVEEGARGRVVVTDLTMRQMPLIRYDLGDLAVAGELAEGGLGLTSITSLEGRSVDAICDSTGTPVSPFAVVVALKEARGIGQFQVAQTGARAYELRLSPQTATVQKEILRKLSAILGKDAEIITIRMREIKPRPSGKLPVVVNDWKIRSGSDG